MATARGPRIIPVELKKGDVAKIYASARVADALEEITNDASLYHGVKLAQVLEAAYLQGRKDGAREVFETVESSVGEAKKAIPHRNVGRPRKKG
jgi:hypothetical protein